MHMHHPGVTGRQQPVDGVSRSGVNGELSGQSRADPVHGVRPRGHLGPRSGGRRGGDLGGLARPVLRGGQGGDLDFDTSRPRRKAV